MFQAKNQNFDDKIDPWQEQHQQLLNKLRRNPFDNFLLKKKRKKETILQKASILNSSKLEIWKKLGSNYEKDFECVYQREVLALPKIKTLNPQQSQKKTIIKNKNKSSIINFIPRSSSLDIHFDQSFFSKKNQDQFFYQNNTPNIFERNKYLKYVYSTKYQNKNRRLQKKNVSRFERQKINKIIEPKINRMIPKKFFQGKSGRDILKQVIQQLNKKNR